jgi:two-component system, OmpR family, KDP operon response regulator KdpE
MVTTLNVVLSDEGHEVCGVYRVGHAKIAYEHFNPDVVLLDIGLPDGSGFAIAQEIRERSDRACPLLIGLTGLYSDGPARTLSAVAGLHHFLTKPFVVEHLLELIRPLTHRSNAA